METAQKFSKLLEKFIKSVEELNPKFEWGTYDNLLSNLKSEIKKLEIEIKSGSTNYKYEEYGGEVIHPKSPNGDVYKFLGMKYQELKIIQNQIDELINPKIQEKYKKMKGKFDALTSDALLKIPMIGFQLVDQDKFQSSFVDKEGLKIKIVDQRYNPPEVWLSKDDNPQIIKLGIDTELYFDSDLQILKKYLDKGLNNFYHSSIDYYLDFLKRYKKKLLKMEDFVTKIRLWQKRNIYEIREIKNTI